MRLSLEVQAHVWPLREPFVIARGCRLRVDGGLNEWVLAVHAPAMVLAHLCSFVDLDGPLLQAEDIENGFEFEHGRVERTHVPDLWG